MWHVYYFDIMSNDIVCMYANLISNVRVNVHTLQTWHETGNRNKFEDVSLFVRVKITFLCNIRLYATSFHFTLLFWLFSFCIAFGFYIKDLVI